MMDSFPLSPESSMADVGRREDPFAAAMKGHLGKHLGYRLVLRHARESAARSVAAGRVYETLAK